jgi:hypothetical protein
MSQIGIFSVTCAGDSVAAVNCIVDDTPSPRTFRVEE